MCFHAWIVMVAALRLDAKNYASPEKIFGDGSGPIWRNRNVNRSILGVIALFLSLCAAGADPVHQHPLDQQSPSVRGALGVVHFESSGARRAQPVFIRGLLLLHSFEYPAARREFQKAQELDPSFAMAVWGEALTYNHTLWNEQDTAAARAALAKLGATPEEQVAKGKTAREREYLRSVTLLYGQGEKAERDAAYSAALSDLSKRYPKDLDARSLYALSLLGLSPRRDIRTYMRAAAEVEAVYEIDRNHPGALHYLIHAYDDPVHAPLGLRAARLYAKVAPAASHAQHMTSHIFFSLGLWDDAIAANEASVRVAAEQGEHAYHSLLWLEYAYLQENKRAAAEALVQSLTHDVATGPTLENRLRAAYIRATWLVETRGAPDPDAMQVVDSSGITSIGYFAVHDFARGLAAINHNDTAAARTALAQLHARIDAAHVVPVGENWFSALSENDLAQARALAAALEGAIVFADGQHAAGIARVKEAISATALMEFEYGPPWSAKPFDELLGELLLADGQEAEAAAAFQRVLVTYPNRRLSVEGLAATRAAH
jgi:tetratricopeptide (TPR) repeat protein